MVDLMVCVTNHLPLFNQNFNIYKHLCVEVFSGDWEGEGGYRALSLLRNLLLGLVETLSHSREDGSQAHKEFQHCLSASHYLTTRTACLGVPQLAGLAAKISVSLLRYTDILPPDRAFYQAGLLCKVHIYRIELSLMITVCGDKFWGHIKFVLYILVKLFLSLQRMGWDNMAFVFFNRFLDLSEVRMFSCLLCELLE